MIYDASRFMFPMRFEADLCVIGSGAGGLSVAMVAAEAGMSVVLLEAGEYLTPADMVQREEEMVPRLYWDSGARTTRDRSVRIHQGRGVGGSTLHNLNLIKRIPRAILTSWRQHHRLEILDEARWDDLYAEVEALLEVSQVPRERWNKHNQLLERGARALGWEGQGLSHNRTGCIGSGFCEIGCAYDAKNNAAKVLLPRAVKAQAEVLYLAQATHIEHEHGKVTGVRGRTLDRKTREPIGTIAVAAPRVCVAGSATSTAAILQRSLVPDPSSNTGKQLRVHPSVVVAGEFEEPVVAWEGIPQTFECTQFLDFERENGPRVWIVPAFAHPVGTATMLPGHGEKHRDQMRKYPHLAVFTAMVHDRTAGTVAPDGDLGLTIEYWPNGEDRRELSRGLWACAKLLFAAGAKRVFVPGRPTSTFEHESEVEPLRDYRVERGIIDVSAVHPMGSIPMSDDPRRAAVGSDGKHHALEGLWIGDGSLFPSSIGVPPQLSIYALGLHVGRSIVDG